MKKKPELLAPTGSFPALVAAVDAGADSIYFGLREFSMRAFAKNFKVSDLPEIKEICKKKNVKIYLTINTIIYDNELKKVDSLIKKVKPFVDAIICWDLSVIQLCKKHKIPFHISTQASVANIEAAKFYKRLGAQRIVLARELNLSQIKKISKIIDVETFIHGAICLSISGRCLMSQFLFNKSANRGACLHPCRRSYIVKDKQEGYELEVENDKIFSAKDLCALPFIEKLKKAGITAFKIEGRNRDPRYVSTVVSVYRKALDKKLTKKEQDKAMKKLQSVYTKGFSSGFYEGLPTSDDFSKTEHSSSTEKKVFIGKIIKFYKKINVATLELKSDLKPKDKIVVIGKTTGVKETIVKTIESKNKSIFFGKKDQEIGIKLPFTARRNDEVYKIVKRK